MEVNILKIQSALRQIKGDGWDGKTMNYIEDTVNSLNKLRESLENVNVKGRDNIDALLGCMVGIDMIIGEEDDG